MLTPTIGKGKYGSDLMVVRPCPHQAQCKPCPCHPFPYLITSSAWKRSVGGSIRPSAWAVLRLTTRLNVSARSMGKSLGLAPCSKHGQGRLCWVSPGGQSQMECPRTFYTDVNGFMCKTHLAVRASGLTAYRSTSSAWKRSVGGMVRPRAFAVFRLTTSSKVMGCSTGRSAGLAPLRILST
jgi:hypothetical protein